MRIKNSFFVISIFFSLPCFPQTRHFAQTIATNELIKSWSNCSGEGGTGWISINKSKTANPVIPGLLIAQNEVLVSFSRKKWRFKLLMLSIHDVEWWEDQFKKNLKQRPVEIHVSEMDYSQESPVNIRAAISFQF